MYDFGPLCVDCDLKFQKANEIKISQLERSINYITDVMYDTAGLPRTGARFPERKAPLLHSGPINLKSVYLNNSVVGNINQGTVQNLNASLQNISITNQGLAQQAKHFTEEVAKDESLTNDQKDEIASKIDFLIQQVQAQKQNTPVVKTIINSVTSIINTSASLITLWNMFSPMFLK